VFTELNNKNCLKGYKTKAPGEPGALLFGWVSKYWELNSQHNIKNYFFIQKKFYQKFYTQFSSALWILAVFLHANE